MTKSMTLRLDPFGRQALSKYAQERSHSASALVRTASLYYLADRDSGRAAWRAPRFLRGAPEGDGVTVDIDDDTWTALSREASGQGIEPARLAEHALLYYLADLDGGRLADRVGGAVKRSERPRP